MRRGLIVVGVALCRMFSAAAALQTIPDVRVEPLLKTEWGQPLIDGRYSGCVATAGAQIMRYFEYPTQEVVSFENTNCAIEGVQTTLRATGGVYDWSAMPDRLDGTEEGREQVLMLMRDIGIGCGINYSEAGSEVGGYMLMRAWTTFFGYASVMAYTLDSDLPLDSVRRALVSNLDAGLPVEIGLVGPKGGHAVVADGYGYCDGVLFYHLNFGWDGNYNGWYQLPTVQPAPTSTPQ